MTNTDFYGREITIDIDPDDSEDLDYAREAIEMCAGSAHADVAVEFLRMEDETAVFRVSGHYMDLHMFNTRWGVDVEAYDDDDD